MPNTAIDPRIKQLHAEEPDISIRLLRTAMVHLTLRAPDNPPRRPMPDLPNPDGLPIELFRFGVTRSIATLLGQPDRCRKPECRRAKICHGMPPDCWRDEPPPTFQEFELARGLMRYHLDGVLRDKAAWEDERDRTAK